MSTRASCLLAKKRSFSFLRWLATPVSRVATILVRRPFLSWNNLWWLSVVSFAALLSLVNTDGLSLDVVRLAEGVVSSLNEAVILGEGEVLGWCLRCANCNVSPDFVLVK